MEGPYLSQLGGDFPKALLDDVLVLGRLSQFAIHIENEIFDCSIETIQTKRLIYRGGGEGWSLPRGIDCWSYLPWC